MQVYSHLSRRDKSEKSLSMCSFLQASAATIHGAPAGPGSTAVAAARYKDKCVLEIVSPFCIENPLTLVIPSGWPSLPPIGLQQQSSQQEDDPQCATQ